MRKSYVKQLQVSATVLTDHVLQLDSNYQNANFNSYAGLFHVHGLSRNNSRGVKTIKASLRVFILMTICSYVIEKWNIISVII